MLDYKTLISAIAVVLTFVGYVPYVRDTLKGKTTPHIFTWFIWALVTAIAYGLQISGGAGVGSWITLAVVVSCIFILFLGLRNGKKDITKIDIVFLLLSLIALYFWLIARQPVLSVILVSTVDLLAFGPTIRKSWNKPHSETILTYEINVVRHGLGLFALQHYSIVTWLYPASWALANAVFAVLLTARRKKIIT